jgi:homoserine O-succinyltransferase/O-acetyltransferase
MPVVIRKDQVDRVPAMRRELAGMPGMRGDRRQRERAIEIGLLNNMPDPALEATERQFVNLLAAAAGELTVRVHLFSLAAIPRGDAARSRLRGVYSCASAMAAKGLDALIVTGTEPRAASIEQEPYWHSLANLIDWAEHNTISTIWSCLAAHAAVFHLDGVRRQPLTDKRFGLFDCNRIGDAAILAGLPAIIQLPHSRWNELREDDLVAHGYDILTRSSTAGVDMFIKKWRSLFVFFQGHPEYDVDTLLREYRRDIGRFLRGERSEFPTMPEAYFAEETEEALRTYEALCRMHRRPELLVNFPMDASMRSERVRSWQASAQVLFKNWLCYLAAMKGTRLRTCSMPDAFK